MIEHKITDANLASLDAATDAEQPPKMILVLKWWLDYMEADRRKRGRLIRQRRRKMKLENEGIETDLNLWVELQRSVNNG